MRLQKIQSHCQTDVLLFFKSAGDDFCGIPGDKIGDQAGTQIADCQRKEIQPAPENTVGDSEPEKQFRRIDMLKNTAVGVAVIACGRKISGFIFLGQVAPHGDCHGISQNDSRQKGQYQIPQQGVGTAPDSQSLYA